ncbi:MAG: hypothetical protein Q8922_12555 [Bacteroidota bacterium]|nr:hypothetical protein [Bacteroidota bacterium]MDP4232226.1 hypothetical protein [Bacteroidota bacterium]MDP4243594.1 hypothetical protein [Bacteroidota bacterium]MDP4288755.1 hypothetical protein [Bacteroidota bacterium]
MKRILFTVAFLCPLVMHAQTPAWPDSSGPTNAGCYRIAVPPLSQAPPLHTDMNWMTLLGYVWIDSMMRHPFTSTDWTALDSMQSPDTLKQFLKYWYAMTDYDPLLFEEYGRDAKYLDTQYWGKPAGLIGYIAQKTSQIMGDSARVATLLASAYILHIRVRNVTRDFDTFAHLDSQAMPVCCVEATIIDTIKGVHIATGLCSLIYPVVQQVDSLPSTGCLHFSYWPVWRKDGGDWLRWSKESDSTSAFPSGSMGWDVLTPGNDYIVFLRSIYLDYDGINSYFALWPMMGDKVGGIYPIHSDTVSDPSNYWGMGSSVPVSTFETGIRQRIWNILNP